MKKYLFIILVLFLFSSKVKAETFYEDNWITGIYAKYKSDTLTKSQLMRFIRRKGDDRFVYCLTPSELLYEDVNYTASFTDQATKLKISNEKLKRIKDIAYFGYGYKNHIEEKWYAITQFMIWKEMDSADIYFTDKFNGNRITRFESEMSEIESLIKKYSIVPNINNLTLNINESYSFNDSNNVLSEYKIDASSDLNISIENNTLKINPKVKGNYKLKFRKYDNTVGHVPIVYTASKGQNIMIRGMQDEIIKEINITVNSGKFTLKKERGLFSVEGAIYNLYKDNKLVKELVLDSNGTASISSLAYGNYTLKEIKAPTGYLLDTKTYNITIDKEDNYLNVSDQVITSNIKVNKFAKDNDNLIKENDIEFSLYDINNNLIGKYKTDINGSFNLNLNYGKYTLRQDTVWLGYKKVDDLLIDITSNEDKEINLINERIESNLTIIKKDKETLNVITNDEVTFKIKDKNNNSIIDEIKSFNGIINTPILGGEYILEEVNSPIGYQKESDTSFIIDNEKVTLTIYNELIKDNIKLHKKGILNDNAIINLSNVKFELYAFEDIVGGDNTVYYKKDQLIDTLITDKNGDALSIKLPLGKYYLKEIEVNDNYILDDKKYVIDLFTNNEITIINREKPIVLNEEEKVEETIEDEETDVLKEDKTLIIKEEKPIILNKIEELKFEPIVFNEKINLEENKEIETLYPKTSNRDKYIKVLIAYILFLGIIFIISSVKHEK